jgi:hypothetical protein
MKKNTSVFVAIVLTAGCAYSASAESRLAGHGFTSTGVFHINTSGAAKVEVSTNLESWTELANVSQELNLEDSASRRPGWRFYRAHDSRGVGSNVVGYVKLSIPPGKMAILGNPFAVLLRLDSPEQRHELFGLTNPAVKISLYTNGNFVAHTLDKTTGTWSPPLRPIRSQEGFAVENLGSSPLQVKMSGQVRLGVFNVSLPSGASLFVPPVPQPGPVANVVGIPGKDGMQIDWFNEETQTHQVSTFDSLSNGWMPKLPDYKPGRAFLVKSPAAVNWTKNATMSER